ncbi:MAG TPA: translation elongation factor Ts [Syntrophaceticus sp.]|nr:translation elongation factor Ts [Syntrophaceticus schinkii]MDD4260868.1 translation elongation factor Ts [Syntrophaceticus schinkii]MDD4674740.1 translation elongation factor Ts [Syntrophaceticus schinkii]HHY30535.1 translation elongation factor Ts [Syntrophaceticus sp.]
MIKAELVKELRERTGSGIMDCKKALQETKGDLEKAIIYLRERGLAAAAKKAGRATKDGYIDAYIHAGGKLGVLIEVNCETDFVAKTDDYRHLCRELAMQVAAANPLYVERTDVPQERIDTEKSVLETQAKNEGKPDKVVEKIVTGRMEKFYQEICLMEQPYIREPDRIVKDLVNEYITKLGENIVVRRFCRFQLGEEG